MAKTLPTASAKNLIVTCMKNEGPFILEWVAHHRAIGFDHMLVFTNDCDDGTVELLDALAAQGYVTRMDNPYQQMGEGYNPQKGALKFAESLDLVKNADWVLVSDVDEFVNIHVGDGDLESLFSATNGADLISMQWRLFGNSFRNKYEDVLLIENHTYCAPTFCPSPIQAWGIKTMFRTEGDYIAGVYDRIGVHRPLKRKINGIPNWVTGAGKPIHPDYADKGWRFGDQGSRLRPGDTQPLCGAKCRKFSCKKRSWSREPCRSRSRLGLLVAYEFQYGAGPLHPKTSYGDDKRAKSLKRPGRHQRPS